MTFIEYKYIVPAMLGSSISYLNVALFPDLQSANAVEGLVKLLSRIMSGECMEAWLIEVWHFQSSHASIRLRVSSLVPRPHPLTRRNSLVNQVKFLGLAYAFVTL